MATRVIGGVQLQRKFRGIVRELDRETLMQAVVAGAEPIATLMSALAPRGTPAEPNLSNIVITKVRSTSAHIAAVWIGPSRDAFYAYFVEFGTKFMAARPFARPAFDRERASTFASLGDEVWQAILKVIR